METSELRRLAGEIRRGAFRAHREEQAVEIERAADALDAEREARWRAEEALMNAQGRADRIAVERDTERGARERAEAVIDLLLEVESLRQYTEELDRKYNLDSESDMGYEHDWRVAGMGKAAKCARCGELWDTDSAGMPCRSVQESQPERAERVPEGIRRLPEHWRQQAADAAYPGGFRADAAVAFEKCADDLDRAIASIEGARDERSA